MSVSSSGLAGERGQDTASVEFFGWQWTERQGVDTMREFYRMLSVRGTQLSSRLHRQRSPATVRAVRHARAIDTADRQRIVPSREGSGAVVFDDKPIWFPPDAPLRIAPTRLD